MPNLRLPRKIAFNRQSGCCFYCKLPMWIEDPEAFARKYGMRKRRARLFQATAEHLIARCDGGTDVPANIVAACAYCNGRRHRPKVPLDPVAYGLRVCKQLAAGKWHGWRWASPAQPRFSRSGR
jgi:hypothetical protein